MPFASSVRLSVSQFLRHWSEGPEAITSQLLSLAIRLEALDPSIPNALRRSGEYERQSVVLRLSENQRQGSALRRLPSRAIDGTATTVGLSPQQRSAAASPVGSRSATPAGDLLTPPEVGAAAAAAAAAAVGVGVGVGVGVNRADIDGTDVDTAEPAVYSQLSPNGINPNGTKGNSIAAGRYPGSPASAPVVLDTHAFEYTADRDVSRGSVSDMNDDGCLVASYNGEYNFQLDDSTGKRSAGEFSENSSEAVSGHLLSGSDRIGLTRQSLRVGVSAFSPLGNHFLLTLLSTVLSTILKD